MTIKKKIKSFAGVVFLIIAFAFIFAIWTVRFSQTEFSQILAENTKSIELVDALEEETLYFEEYIRNPEEEKLSKLQAACEKSEAVIEALSFEYSAMGELRYSKTWSIRNSYTVYSEKREELLISRENDYGDIRELYDIYAMQDSLQNYARTLMRYTIEEGNVSYQQKVPQLETILVIVVILGIILFLAMVKATDMMNKTLVSPIMELVDMSKKIADNEFFIDDLQVKSQDELGELVRAFNKMKYATGEYILTLEISGIPWIYYMPKN